MKISSTKKGGGGKKRNEAKKRATGEEKRNEHCDGSSVLFETLTSEDTVLR